MNSDDIITIDLSSSGDYTSMAGTVIDTDIGTAGYTTLTLDPGFQISLDDGIGLGSWYEERRILDEYNEEKALRENNEGIQKAWEQYKILVELAKNPPECI